MRKAGSSRELTWPSIRKAAIELLYERGFEGMNLRELSRAVGLQAGSLYNYFSSKDDLLFRLISELMDDLIAELESAIAKDDDPLEQLKRIVEILVIRHSKRRKEVYIGHLEMRSLPEDRYKAYVEKRDRTERLVRRILADGRKAGLFDVPDEKIATVSIFTMLTGIADWYRPNGRLSVRQLIEIYTELVLKLLRPENPKAGTKSVPKRASGARPRKSNRGSQDGWPPSPSLGEGAS